MKLLNLIIAIIGFLLAFGGATHSDWKLFGIGMILMKVSVL